MVSCIIIHLVWYKISCSRTIAWNSTNFSTQLIIFNCNSSIFRYRNRLCRNFFHTLTNYIALDIWTSNSIKLIVLKFPVMIPSIFACYQVQHTCLSKCHSTSNISYIIICDWMFITFVINIEVRDLFSDGHATSDYNFLVG